METRGVVELTQWVIIPARVIHRFSTRGAMAGLAVGALAFAAPVPWLPGLGAASLRVGIASRSSTSPAAAGDVARVGHLATLSLGVPVALVSLVALAVTGTGRGTDRCPAPTGEPPRRRRWLRSEGKPTTPLTRS